MARNDRKHILNQIINIVFEPYFVSEVLLDTSLYNSCLNHSLTCMLHHAKGVTSSLPSLPPSLSAYSTFMFVAFYSIHNQHSLATISVVSAQ